MVTSHHSPEEASSFPQGNRKVHNNNGLSPPSLFPEFFPCLRYKVDYCIPVSIFCCYFQSCCLNLYCFVVFWRCYRARDLLISRVYKHRTQAIHLEEVSQSLHEVMGDTQVNLVASSRWNKIDVELLLVSEVYSVVVFCPLSWKPI